MALEKAEGISGPAMTSTQRQGGGIAMSSGLSSTKKGSPFCHSGRGIALDRLAERGDRWLIVITPSILEGRNREWPLVQTILPAMPVERGTAYA